MPDVKVEIVGENQPVSGPGSISETGAIDFALLKKQAGEMWDKEHNDEPADSADPALQVVKPEGNIDPATQRVKGATPKAPSTAKPVEKEQPVDVDTASERKLATLKDDELVEVLVDGEPEVMTWKEARAGISRTSKFTKGMQQLAKDRETVEASKGELSTLKTDRDNLNRFLSNPKAVLNYVLQQHGPEVFSQIQGVKAPDQPEAKTFDPNELASLGETNQLLDNRLKPLQERLENTIREFDNKLVAKEQEIENKRTQLNHEVAIKSTLTEIFTTNPVLNALPNAEQNIRYEVFKLQPKTEAEALEAFKTVAQGIVEDLGKHYKAKQTIDKVAAAKAKMEKSSIEPAGGSAVQIQPANYKKADGSIDWNQLRKMAETMI